MNLPHRVLIVEDEPALASALRAVLQKAGYEVETAESVEQAIPLVDRFRPHAILTDGNLPGAAGIALAGFLRQSDQHRGIKIIAMSGDPGQKQLMSILKDQLHAFLAKPFKSEVLLETLARLLGSQ